jgi:hypothetical protein
MKANFTELCLAALGYLINPTFLIVLLTVVFVHASISLILYLLKKKVLVGYVKNASSELTIYCEDKDFALWAFGDIWPLYLTYDRDSIDLMHAWNEKHGNLLLLHKDDLLYESMNKMKEIYETNSKPYSKKASGSPTMRWNEKSSQGPS